MSRPFESLLVANRGEAAMRIVRSARRLGLRTVGVFSDADATSPAVRACDAAVRLGGPSPADSYLSIGRLVDAARTAGAEAVHPGWGFLAENAEMARACREAGLVWVGPEAEAIERLGDKSRARREMEAAGVPVLAGREIEHTVEAAALAEELGYPVLVKAVAGGGGRGLRRVSDAAELAAAVGAARREAVAAFGDDRLLVERFVQRARHVEVQVIGDGHSRIATLGTRDCSLQRRHQKVLEEAPAPGLDSATSRRLDEVARAAAGAVGYTNAGTVEMLLDRDSGEVWFLEMNTRLQVEHPVTECVFGLDIVELQLRVAAGEALPEAFRESSGHAVEVRLIAEDPSRGFRPSAGTVRRWVAPQGEGIRVDHALADGVAVPPHYDSLLAKVVATGPDRPTAIRRLRRALDSTVVLGVATNRELLARLLDEEDVRAGDVDTEWLERHLERLAVRRPDEIALLRAVAGLLLTVDPATPPDPWRSTGEPARWTVTLRDGDETLEVSLALREIPSFDPKPGAGTARFALEVGGRVHDIVWEGTQIRLTGPAGESPVRFVRDGTGLDLEVRGIGGRFELVDPLVRTAERRPETEVRAPLAGRVARVEVAEGDRVTRGERLVAIDSMKMETWLTAAADGTVVRVAVEVDRQVRTGQVLVELEPFPVRGPAEDDAGAPDSEER